MGQKFLSGSVIFAKPRIFQRPVNTIDLGRKSLRSKTAVNAEAKSSLERTGYLIHGWTLVSLHYLSQDIYEIKNYMTISIPQNLDHRPKTS